MPAFLRVACARGRLPAPSSAELSCWSPWAWGTQPVQCPPPLLEAGTWQQTLSTAQPAPLPRMVSACRGRHKGASCPGPARVSHSLTVPFPTSPVSVLPVHPSVHSRSVGLSWVAAVALRRLLVGVGSGARPWQSEVPCEMGLRGAPAGSRGRNEKLGRGELLWSACAQWAGGRAGKSWEHPKAVPGEGAANAGRAGPGACRSGLVCGTFGNPEAEPGTGLVAEGRARPVHPYCSVHRLRVWTGSRQCPTWGEGARHQESWSVPGQCQAGASGPPLAP